MDSPLREERAEKAVSTFRDGDLKQIRVRPHHSLYVGRPLGLLLEYDDCRNAFMTIG